MKGCFLQSWIASEALLPGNRSEFPGASHTVEKGEPSSPGAYVRILPPRVHCMRGTRVVKSACNALLDNGKRSCTYCVYARAEKRGKPLPNRGIHPL